MHSQSQLENALHESTERVGSVYILQNARRFKDFVGSTFCDATELDNNDTLTDLGQQLVFQLKDTNVNVIFRKVAAADGTDNKNYNIGYVVVENNVSNDTGCAGFETNAKLRARVSRV